MQDKKQIQANAISVVTGIVTHGKGIGRQLGFPTANIVPDEGIRLPRNGVYVALLEIEDSGTALRAILNQGKHPTFPDGKPTIEVHALDGNMDLYQLRVRLSYASYLREERRFSDAVALKKQLEMDRNAALDWFNRHL